MSWKKPFWKWILLFATLGVVISVLLALQWFIFRVPFRDVEAILWPSSLMFMALDAPGTSWSTIAIVYLVAVVENVLLYVVVGLFLWPIAYLIRRRQLSRVRR